MIDKQIKINFDDQFSYGLNAGIDVPFKADGPVFFALAVKYLISDLKKDSGLREIAIDPIIGSIGIGAAARGAASDVEDAVEVATGE